MAKKSKEQTYGPEYGFMLKKKRSRPPIELDPREWARRTQSTVYINRIKRSVRDVNTYLLLVRNRARGVSGHQRDACHYFADVATVDTERRTRGGNSANSTVAVGQDVLTDSVKY